MNTVTENTASQKQIDFINRLKGERHWLPFDPDDLAGNVVRAQDEPEAYMAGLAIHIGRNFWHEGQFTKAVASQVIDALLAAPEKPKRRNLIDDLLEGDPSADAGNDRTWAEANPGVDLDLEPTPEGVHKFGGVIFKVQKAVHGSGRLYAKALVEDGNGGWTFEYAPGAIKNLSAATRLTLEEAKRFGVLYGTCCVCGRTLTNEESIAAGIGPICAGKF